jgi:hypothetical protein
MSFIAGRYTATFNLLSLGQMAEGFRLSHQFFKRLITGDAGGDAPQDGVYRGAEMMLSATALEYNAAGIATAMWPYGSFLTMGTPGRLDVGSDIIESIVLTAIAGTPAATVPATLTLPQCVLAEGFPVDLLFAPDLREVPLRFRVYPNATTYVFGSTT